MTNAWNPQVETLTTVEAIEAEWERGLRAKGTIELVEWEQSAARLREAAAMLRDALVPVAGVRERLVAVVDAISQQLPERRTGGR